VSLLDLPVEQVASSPPSLLSVAVAAGVSVIVFWLGYRLNAAAAQRERQRKAIEDWFRALSKWVDDSGEPSRTPEYNYNLLTSREIIELSLPRRHRFLAWWMHEMAVAVMDRRLVASKSLESREKCRSDLNRLLRETGGRLLEWHHRKLKSSDFQVPYQLRAAARSAGMNVQEYADARQLGDYVAPVRMTLRRQWAFQRLLLNPATGMPILEALKSFIGRKYALNAYLYSVAAAAGSTLRLSYTKLKLFGLGRRLRRLRVRRALRKRRTATLRRQGQFLAKK
jgi:hypothetical protein